MRFLLIMAWRDSRRHRTRLLLFTLSVVLGMAALVAIETFSYNLQRDIDLQAQAILGADLELRDTKPIPDTLLAHFRTQALQEARQFNFASMVRDLRTGESRLADVRALFGDFPFYGQLETAPAQAGRSFRDQQEVLIDQGLLLQLQGKVGDSLQIGQMRFRVAGTMEKAPGQSALFAMAVPVLYFPGKYLEATGLIQPGSRVNYRYFFQMPEPALADTLVKQHQYSLNQQSIRSATAESRQQSIGSSYQDMVRFLDLVGFIALLLGCIGVASAIHVYIRGKVSSIAILRCLGASEGQAFLIYLLQVVAIGFVGALLGTALGAMLQRLLPALLKDLLLIEVGSALSWPILLKGLFTGTLTALLFGLLPLLGIREISPLQALREGSLHARPTLTLAKAAVYLLILGFVLGFSYLQTHNWTQALGFSGGLLLFTLLLGGVGYALMLGARRFFPQGWSYLPRQGMANLFRPNNQTVALVTTIGLSTCLIALMLFLQHMLLERVRFSGSGQQPNMVLFDIQPAQHQPLRQTLAQYNLPILQDLPMVTLRIGAINGRDKMNTLADSANQIPASTFDWEYRVTYRDTLSSSEQTQEGQWQGQYAGSGPIPVSLSDQFARMSKLKIGDQLAFNAQGMPLQATVTHLRKVNFSRLEANFSILFPKGALEQMPQAHIIATRTPDRQTFAQLRDRLGEDFPNVSSIDLELILRTVQEILDRIAFVIEFMALFSMATGVVILTGAVLNSRYQRLRENALLHTLGATDRQVLTIMGTEYALLGSFSALAGLLLAWVGCAVLSVWLFESLYLPSLLPSLLLWAFISMLTTLVGMANSYRTTGLQLAKEQA